MTLPPRPPRCRMKYVSSLAILFASITLVAALSTLLVRGYNGDRMAFIGLVILLPPSIYAAISIPLYLLLNSLGSFNRYIDRRVAGAESPFATDRLPTQIIPPQTLDEAK